MIKKIFLVLLTTFSFVFMSCLHDCTPKEIEVRGKYISNLPEWAKDTLTSEWKPWNTDENVEFKKLFKQKESLNSDANINYRLFVTGQNIVLFFDDEERTACNPLWIWVAEYGTDSTINIPQKKEDEFVFTGHAKSNHFEKNTEQNRAYVELKLLNKETSECNYVLKVNDIEIINEKMTACFSKNSKIYYSDLMDIFNYTDQKEIGAYESFSAPYCVELFGSDDDRFMSNMFLYFEGLSEEKTYDETSKTLTYKLLGGTEKMCHYMDIQFVTKDEINCHFYDLINGKKNIRYTEPLD